MRVLLEFSEHHYMESYEPSSYHCPLCGLKSLWVEENGDYYVGSRYLCTTCGCSTRLDGTTTIREPEDIRVLEQLRSGITYEPATPRGN